MNQGENGNDPFNFSSFSKYFEEKEKREKAAAKAAATRAARRMVPPSRFQPRRGMAAAPENVNMGAAAAAANSGWGGEELASYDRPIARGANSRRVNERPPRAVSRRGRARTPTRPSNRSYRNNGYGNGYGNNPRKTYTANNTRRRNIPASEIRETPRHTSILEKAQVVVDTEHEPLSPNNSKRHFQLQGYENKLALLKKFKREHSTNVHINVINQAISILEKKLGIRSAASATAAAAAAAVNVNMRAAAAVAAPAPKKERTFHTRQLKPIIEKYVAKGQIDKAIPFIQLLSTRTDRTPADNMLLEQHRQYIPSYQASQADIDLLEGLTASIAGLSMGNSKVPNNNNL